MVGAVGDGAPWPAHETRRVSTFLPSALACASACADPDFHFRMGWQATPGITVAFGWLT